MRKRIYVFVLLVFFFVVFVRRTLHAQTTGFSKISPGWNQTLWTTDYSYKWTFSWKPYTGSAAFDHYVIKFHSNDGLTVIKQITVPGGKGATSMVIDFATITEIVKGNSYYQWSLGAYNGTNPAPVAEADSLPASNGTKSGFRVPLYTAGQKTWTINASIKCPTNTVLVRNVRTFWAAWTEGQNHPYDFSWHNGPYSTALQQSATITSRTAPDTVYFGLESDLIVNRKGWYGYPTPPPTNQELIPVGLPWASNMDSLVIYQGTWFNPSTAMTAWKSELPSGSYSVAFAVPTPYDTEWCVIPSLTPTITPKPTLTLTPTPMPTTFVCDKSSGDANCDGLVNETDYTIWRCEYLGTCSTPSSTLRANFNNDTQVDLIDFEIWRSKVYGTTNIPTPPAP